MTNNKKSFLIYKDSLNILDELDNEQSGMLFKAIKSYHLGEELNLDPLIKIAFSPFKNQFIRDSGKYEIVVERNKLNGLKGGRPKNPVEPKKPSGLNDNPNNPVKADSGKDSDSDKDSDKGNDKGNDNTLTVASAPKFNFKSELLALGVNAEILDDWLTVRKKKKASNTKTAFKSLITEITKSGLMVNDAIEYAASKSWSGFKSQWYFNDNPVNNGLSKVTQQNLINLEGDW